MRDISRPSAIGPAISSDLIVVFGAGVRVDGTPSPALAHRIARAAQAAREFPHAPLFCSGAIGRHGPSEASVIGRLLATAVDPARLILDEASADTLQTVRASTAWMKRHGRDIAIPCTDRYHQPRVRMLFALAGVKSMALPIDPVGARRQRLWMQAREAAAIPYDFVAGIGQLVIRR